jgi:hypothetical protein
MELNVSVYLLVFLFPTRDYPSSNLRPDTAVMTIVSSAFLQSLLVKVDPVNLIKSRPLPCTYSQIHCPLMILSFYALL